MGTVGAGFELALLLAFGWPSVRVSADAQATLSPYTIAWFHPRAETFEKGKPALFTVELSDRIDIGSDGILSPDPLELRPLDGRSSPIRPTFHLVQGETFEAWVTFDRTGEWQVILYPDVTASQRSLLPTVVPTESIISVATEPPGWLGPVLMLGMGLGLLAFAFGGRKRKEPERGKLAPVHRGDSWWWGRRFTSLSPLPKGRRIAHDAGVMLRASPGDWFFQLSD